MKNINYNVISHRGNITGPDLQIENHPDQIDKIIDQINNKKDIIQSNLIGIEIDIRWKNNNFYLGHDEAQYEIDIYWLLKRANYLFIHCKDYESLYNIINQDYENYLHYFYHTSEKYTITSKRMIWMHDWETPPSELTIVPLLDRNSIKNYKFKNYKTIICTDYIYEI